MFFSPHPFINCWLAVSLGIAPTGSFSGQSNLHFGSVHNCAPSLAPPLPFLSDGGVLVQTRAAQRLVARAGQYGADGRCVSLSPHLWHGLRLSVVSTHPPPPPPATLDPRNATNINLSSNCDCSNWKDNSDLRAMGRWRLLRSLLMHVEPEQY